jgi:nucleotide-binding universal stress UspA family protein
MNTVLIILKMLPVLMTAVRAVEEAIPLPGQGKKKLDLVLNILRTAYDSGVVDVARDFTWERLVNIVVPMIARIVDLHNELGLFLKTQPSKA